MKFIGQFIQDFIARFRSDVYLENIADGTVANDKFLGLDSNNKIVKETVTSSSGDITSVVVTTDTGAGSRISVASGDVAFSIIGDSGVNVTNSGGDNTIITASAVAGEIDHDSLAGFVANEHIDWTASSAGTIHSTNIPTLNQNTTGSAATLSTARAFQTDLASTSTANFDGSAANTHGVTGTLAVGNGGTGLTSISTLLNSNTTKSDVGLGNVENKSAATIIDEIVAGDIPTLNQDTTGNANTATALTSGNKEITGNLEITGSLSVGNKITGDNLFIKKCIRLTGYGTSDGTNFEAPEIISDNNAPYEHNTSYGSDGLTAQQPRQFMKTGYVMPFTGKITKWKGWSSTAGTTGTTTISIFKATVTRNDPNNVTPVLLKSTSYTPLGNTRLEDFEETSFSVTFTAGDIMYTAVKCSVASKAWWLNSTLEVEQTA